MSKHFLVFAQGRWIRTNRLPVAKVPPPEEHQIRWLIRGWDQYIICARKRIWRKPHVIQVNGHSRRRDWKEILIQERRTGYKGIDLYLDGECHYFSLPQLRRLLVRLPSQETSSNVAVDSAQCQRAYTVS